jgi:hypothetical protein
MITYLPNRRRLPARYAAVLLPLVLSTLMTCIVSGISTLKNVGLSDSFVRAWMSAWGVSWLIGFPALLLVLPIVRAVVGLVVEPEG